MVFDAKVLDFCGLSWVLMPRDRGLEPRQGELVRGYGDLVGLTWVPRLLWVGSLGTLESCFRILMLKDQGVLDQILKSDPNCGSLLSPHTRIKATQLLFHYMSPELA